jgi:hypothetical protein
MDDQTQNTEIPSPTGQPADQPAAARIPLRERVLGLRAVVAVALASVVLGGAGGAALAAAGTGNDDGTGGGRFGPPGQNGVPFPNGQQPGSTLPPTTDPDTSDGAES